jgi:hypothetical protein
MKRVRRVVLAMAVLACCAAAAAGCGSGGSKCAKLVCGGGAGVYKLQHFSFTGAAPNRPASVSFSIAEPSGATLTRFRTGASPHTGIHLIFVRGDLAEIVHHHPVIGADGSVKDSVTLPSAGPWRLLVDVYPNLPHQTVPNFQLRTAVTVPGAYTPQPTPPFSPTAKVDGYTFTMQSVPKFAAAQATFMDVKVTGPDGKPAQFQPWFGAVAHAVFFHAGDLAYFHTHVCSPQLPACSGGPVPSSATGSSTKPGELNVGVLLPTGGTWRLFLQCQVDGKVLSAPFTLNVAG